MTHPLAYIRVALASDPDARGMARAFTVNQDGEAFDGAGIAPGFVCVHVDAITPAPIERSVEAVQLWYGGKPLNRVPRAGRKE